MSGYKYAASLLAIAPSAILAIIFFLYPSLILGEREIDLDLILGFAGVSLSYLSLVFAAYAALEVQFLADTYFFKMRTPAILRKLDKVTKAISEFSSEPLSEIPSQAFMSESPVVLRSAKRVKNKDVIRVAKEAERLLETLKVNYRSVNMAQKPAGQLEQFWKFYQKMSELSDELRTQIKEKEALP